MFESPQTPLEIDDIGVRRYSGDQLVEAVAWADVSFIAIATTDEGPLMEDFYWVLGTADGKGCAVPNGLAQDHGLLEVLQQRYGDGFDNESVIRACGCTDDGWFPCWSRADRGDHPTARPTG